jgi:hypothetical protein
MAKSKNLTHQYASPSVFFPYSQSDLASTTPSPYSFYIMNSSYMSALYDALGIKRALTSASYVCDQIQQAVPKSSQTALEEDLWTAWSAVSQPSRSDNLPSSRKLLADDSPPETPALSSCTPMLGSSICQLTVRDAGTYKLILESPGFLPSSTTLTVASTSLTTDITVPMPPVIPASQTLFLVSWTSGETLNVQVSTPFGCTLNSDNLDSFCFCGSTTVNMTKLAPSRYQVLIQSPVPPDASSSSTFTYAVLVTPSTTSRFGNNTALNAPVAMSGITKQALQPYSNTLRMNCSNIIGLPVLVFVIEVFTPAGTFLAFTRVATGDPTAPPVTPFQVSVAEASVAISSIAQVNIACVIPPCPSAFLLSFDIGVVAPNLTTCQCFNCQNESQISLVMYPLPIFGITGAQYFSSFMVSNGVVFPASMNTNFACPFTTGTNQKGPTLFKVVKRTFVPLGLRFYAGQVSFVADQQQLVPAKSQPSYGYATFNINATATSILTPLLTFSAIVWSSLSSSVTTIGIYSLSADLSTKGQLIYAVCGISPASACPNGSSATVPGFQLPASQSRTLYKSMLTGSPVYYLSFLTANNPLGEIGSILLANDLADNVNTGMSQNGMFPPIVNPQSKFMGLSALLSGNRTTYIPNRPPHGQTSNLYSQLLAPSAAVNFLIDVSTNPFIPFSSFSSCQTSNAALSFPPNSFLLSAPGPLASFNPNLSDSSTFSLTLNAPMSPGLVSIVIPANIFKLKNVVATLSVVSVSSGNYPPPPPHAPSALTLPLLLCHQGQHPLSETFLSLACF